MSPNSAALSDRPKGAVVFRTSISKKAISLLPLIRYYGPIRLVSRKCELNAAIESLTSETLLGFDTETRPAFRKGESYPPSLLQLAGSDTVYLFQIKQLGNFRRILREVLANRSITKVGVAIRDDIKKLREISNFKPAGFIELSACTLNRGIVNTGLRSLAALYLHGRISKSAQVTNWSRSRLTSAQIRYAATDAWMSRQLYLRFCELGMTNPTHEGKT